LLLTRDEIPRNEVVFGKQVKLELLRYYDQIFLRPEKSTLRFFALRALQFWEIALVFHYHLGKFGLNIFPNLKTKQVKY